MNLSFAHLFLSFGVEAVLRWILVYFPVFRNSSISVSTKSISVLLTKWSSQPSNTIVIMFVLKTFSFLTFAQVSFQYFWNMFIISYQVGWEIFFDLSAVFRALIPPHAYDILLWLACDMMYHSPVCHLYVTSNSSSNNNQKVSLFQKSFFHFWNKMSWIIIKNKNTTWGKMNRNCQQWFNVL